MEEKKTPPKTPSWAQATSAPPAKPAAGTTSKPANPTAAPSAKPGAKPAAPAVKPAAAAPAGSSGANPYTQWYEVQSGDTLWKIAKEKYGDGNLYTEIFKANQDVLTDPDKIKVGQKLRIP